MLFTKHVIEVSKKIFSLKKVSNCILIAIVPALLFYSFSLFGLKSRGFEIMEILRDPAQQSGASSFLGFLSNIGIWLWVSSSSICFFTIITSGYNLKKKSQGINFFNGYAVYNSCC